MLGKNRERSQAEGRAAGRQAIDLDRREENVTGDPRIDDDRDERQRTRRSSQGIDDVGFRRSSERAFVDEANLIRVTVQ